ncbi:hypothetical protein ACOAK2_11500 (plasmid) [Aliarcobacter butzleri]|uniref:hypothetical protein n=2 Tax=Aliarcobacter butzleri TaxID=28197 RepID=UPI003B28742F
MYNNIVLVADIFEHTEENINFNSTTLEKPSQEYIDDVVKALTIYSKQVFVCNSPKELNNYLVKNSVDFVMTIYGGEISRNRLALVPAICESMNVKFLGADVYNRIICQDKNLCKTFAKRFNILSPNSILIYDENDISLIKSLKLPLVVKPNYEGSSIGISNKNIVNTFVKAITLIKELLEIFKQPIIVEEFIGGQEVNITLVGDNKNINIFEVIEDIHIEDINFFNNNLYTLEYKQLYCEKFSHKVITDKFDVETKNYIIDMYRHMGKVDYLRVDGKILNNKFYLIELTPDPYCGRESSFSKAIMSNGYSYEESIGLLIQNCSKYYQTQYSNEIIRTL